MLSTADRLEIDETLALHAHVFDADELDRLDELFTPEAVYDMSPLGMGVFEGVEQIRAAAARLAASGHAPLAHFLTNVVLTETDTDTDPDAATATAASKGLMVMADGGVRAVTQVDELRRTGDGWRIERRVVTPVRPRVG